PQTCPWTCRAPCIRCDAGRSVTAFADGADLGVVPVEQLLARPRLAALLSLVRGADGATGPLVPLGGIAGDRPEGQAVDDAVLAGRCQVVHRVGQRRRRPDQLAMRIGEELHVHAMAAMLARVVQAVTCG